MKRTVEREIKLRAENGFALPDIPGEPLRAAPVHVHLPRHPRHRLAAGGITLRLPRPRRVGAVAAEAAPRRRPAGAGAAGNAGAGARRASRDLIAGVIRGRPMLPVATLDTDRRGVRVTRAAAPDWPTWWWTRSVVGAAPPPCAASTSSRWSWSTAIERARAADRQALRARRGPATRDERPKLLRALGLERTRRPPGRPAPAAASIWRRCSMPVPGDPRPRSGHAAGQRSGGAAPAPGGRPPAARAAAGGAADARPAAGWRACARELRWAGARWARCATWTCCSSTCARTRPDLGGRCSSAFAARHPRRIEERAARPRGR